MRKKSNKNTKKEQEILPTTTSATITTSFNTSMFIINIVLNGPNAFIHEPIRKKAL